MKLFLRRILPLAAAALFLLSGCAGKQSDVSPTESTSSPLPTSPSGFLDYNNPEKGFAMAYPENWSMQEDSEHASVLFVQKDTEDGQYASSVNAVCMDRENSALIGGYVSYVEEELSSTIENYTRVSSDAYTLNGCDAEELCFTGSLCSSEEEDTEEATTACDPVEMKFLQVYLSHEKCIYVITCVSTEEGFPAMESTMRQIVNSFYPLES